jgi:hypothetical protein
MKWKLEQRDDIGFDGETHGEYVYQVPVAAKEGRRDRLEFHELVDYVNRLEKAIHDMALVDAITLDPAVRESRINDIRRMLEGESSNG